MAIEKIQSFTVDHDKLEPGLYISRVDGSVTTYDLRTRKPNGGDYMDNLTMHSVEHMLATYLRGGEWGEHIIYFGPMGCQTGFYLLVRGLSPKDAKQALIAALESTLTATEMFGATREECGNYRNLSLDAAKAECAAYLDVLKNNKGDFTYAE